MRLDKYIRWYHLYVKYRITKTKGQKSQTNNKPQIYDYRTQLPVGLGLVQKKCGDNAQWTMVEDCDFFDMGVVWY